MAQIRLITDERINVKESYEEILRIMYMPECMETGLIQLNDRVEIIGFKNGEEESTYKYEPVTINRSSIMMFY